MEALAKVIGTYGPAGILAFLVIVCHKLTIKELRSAYDSHDKSRIMVHTTIYCFNWLLIGLAIFGSFWTWNQLNVRPRYAIEGVIFGVGENEKITFWDPIYWRRGAEDRKRIEWLMSSVTPLTGRCFSFAIQPASGPEQAWAFMIKPDYYDRTLGIHAEEVNRPFPILMPASGKSENLKQAFECGKLDG